MTTRRDLAVAPSPDGELEAAPRDASFYRCAHGRGQGAHAYHVIRDDGLGGCGIVLLDDLRCPADLVDDWQRCRRRGCRERWPQQQGSTPVERHRRTGETP